jgi:hypothetical protein
MEHEPEGHKTEVPEPKQEQGNREQNQPQQDDEEFQRLVEDLFDSYHPGSPLEEAEVVRMAHALWKRRRQSGQTLDIRRLDQEFDVALAHLMKSQSIRKKQAARGQTTIVSNLRRNNRSWARIRPRAGLEMRAQPQRAREALQFWLPQGVSFTPATPDPHETDARRRRILELELKQLSRMGLTRAEHIELAEIKTETSTSERDPLEDSILAFRNKLESSRHE